MSTYTIRTADNGIIVESNHGDVRVFQDIEETKGLEQYALQKALEFVVCCVVGTPHYVSFYPKNPVQVDPVTAGESTVTTEG